MKLLLAILGIALVLGSLFADYKWKQWIRRRQQNHEAESGHGLR